MKSNSLAKLLGTHPATEAKIDGDRADLLSALNECATSCTICADACLAETQMVEHLRRCIRLNLDCADVCAALARVAARIGDPSPEVPHALLHACAVACQFCAEECAAHARQHEHCRLCAIACRQCQEHCNLFLGKTSSAGVVTEDAMP